MARIKQLSSALANKIAAGEVVARPASVVKECMENSIDANSTAIVLDVEQGGTRLIRITDNGDGIVKEDLPLALEAHATSKINTVEDLLNIHSLGFRGEALASIAAVSHFSLASKPKSQEQGWQVQGRENSDELAITPTPQLEGTTVTVHDLFYNVPARRKFLRAPKTELQHIMEIVKALALSHFYVGFTVQQQKKAVTQWPAVIKGQEEKRIQQVVGSHFLSHALSIDFHGEGLRLWGWLGTPEGHRSHSDCQYIFVNGRMVQDRMLAHGVRQAYGHDLPEGRYGAYVLYLELLPSEVDVNVHPTKREVRFQHSRLVHDFLVTRLQSAFATAQHPVGAQKKDDSLWDLAPPMVLPETVDSAIVTPQKNFSVEEETAMPYEVIYGTPLAQSVDTLHGGVSSECTVEAKVGDSSQSTVRTSEDDPLPQCLGVYEEHYGLIKCGEQLYAMEISLALTQYYRRQHKKGGSMKPLLMPMALTFSPERVAAMELCYEQWRNYGLDCHTFSEDTVMVRGLPTLDIPLEGAPSKLAMERCLETLTDCGLKNTSAITEIMGALLGECICFERIMEKKDCLQKLLEVNKEQANVMIPITLSCFFINE